jgi:hypothetical protein
MRPRRRWMGHDAAPSRPPGQPRPEPARGAPGAPPSAPRQVQIAPTWTVPGCKTPGLFTGRDPLGGTAAILRRLPRDALPVSALSADEPDGAHAAGEPTEQAWSSLLPPSLAFMEEPWRATSAAPLLRLLIPGLAMPAGVTAHARVQVPSVRPQNDVGSIASTGSHGHQPHLWTVDESFVCLCGTFILRYREKT